MSVGCSSFTFEFTPGTRSCVSNWSDASAGARLSDDELQLYFSSLGPGGELRSAEGLRRITPARAGIGVHVRVRPTVAGAHVAGR